MLSKTFWIEEIVRIKEMFREIRKKIRRGCYRRNSAFSHVASLAFIYCRAGAPGTRRIANRWSRRNTFLSKAGRNTFFFDLVRCFGLLAPRESA